VLELWESRTHAALFRVRPNAVGADGVSRRYNPLSLHSLNEQNETIQSLYQCGTPEELEAAVGEWLMNTIQKLELEKAQGQSDPDGLGSNKSA
jgi:hypothetical protein